MKFEIADLPINFGQVRPLAGAGIEIAIDYATMQRIAVRPLAGAGIEISSASSAESLNLFAPLRGRELKYKLRLRRFLCGLVRPLAGAGIEICTPR